MESRRARWNGAAVTFVLAVLFRVALFLSGAVAVMFETGDSFEYRLLAESLLKDHVFGWDGVPKMNRTPGYPAFLAVVFATVGRSQLAVTGAQIVLDALTCAMIFDLAARLRLRRAGAVVASAFAVTCVFTAALSFQVMTETLYTFGIVASVWLLPAGPITRLLHPENRWRVAASGFTMSCAALVRPLEAFAVAVFGVLVAVTLARRVGVKRVVRRQPLMLAALGTAAVLVAGACAMLVPWMARNRIVFHWEYEKPNHEHVTLLGYKTDVPVYRHWYSREFTFYRRSYEEPMVMETPYEAPSIARYVYPEERREVADAFRELSKEIRASETEPIKAETLQAFQRIGERRYASAPRLVVTAPLSRAAKLWVAPRASLLLKDQHGGTLSLRTTVLLTLYDLVYVIPGMVGLWLGFRRARTIRAAIFATIIAHTAMHTFWHSSPHSRYMVPMFPLLCLGIGAVVDRLVSRRAPITATAAVPSAAR
ncbi:MAG TPA: hypothetical protein VM925_16230 [Labilithrix sp.]|nr:hypothetical protein [Labilithrix sp.]